MLRLANGLVRTPAVIQGLGSRIGGVISHLRLAQPRLCGRLSLTRCKAAVPYSVASLSTLSTPEPPAGNSGSGAAAGGVSAKPSAAAPTPTPTATATGGSATPVGAPAVTGTSAASTIASSTANTAGPVLTTTATPLRAASTATNASNAVATAGAVPLRAAIHPKAPNAPPEVGNSHSLWINNVYRFGLLINYWRIIGKPFEKYFNLHPGQRMEQQVHAELRDTFGKHGIGLNVSHIVSQFKERGVYVTFAHPKYAELAYKKRDLLRFRGKPLDAYIVKGVPFIEDIVMTKESPKIRVTLYPPPPSNDKDKDTPAFFHAQNQFFGLLRPYGLCYDLVAEGKNVIVTFVTTQAATTARNCLHGWRVAIQPPATQKPTISNTPPPPGAGPTPVVPPTPTAADASQGVLTGSLVVSFEPYSRFKWIREAFMNPRLLPILVLLVIVSLLMLIGPIRLVRVTQNLATAWSEKDNPKQSSLQERDEIAQLRALFQQLPTSVTVITGPKGSGKSDLIKKILHKRRFVARIDCANKDMITSSASTKESAFIENLQHAIGFSPSFSSINTLISYFETLLPTKSQALTATQQSQLTSVLSTLETALRVVSINFPRNQSTHFDYPVVVFDGFHTLIQALETRSNTDKDRETSQLILDALIKWSIDCTQINQTAHIVFVADNAFTTDILSRNDRLRGRLNEIFIGDLPRQPAFEYIAENVAAHAKNVDASEEAAAAAKPAAVASSSASTNKASDAFGFFSILKSLAKLPGTAPRDATAAPETNTAPPAPAPPTPTAKPAGAPASPKSKQQQQQQHQSASSRATAAAAGAVASVAAAVTGSSSAEEDDSEEHIKISPPLAAAIHRSIDVVGGRMSDMDSLVNRTRTGKSINDALREMMAESKRDLTSRGFGSKLFLDTPTVPGRAWNQVHLWKCIKLITSTIPAVDSAAAANNSLATSGGSSASADSESTVAPVAAAPAPALMYRNVLYSVFDGDEEALRSLVSENLLSLHAPPRLAPPITAASGGAAAAVAAAERPAPETERWVNAGSPLLLSAMRQLTADRSFVVLMDNLLAKTEIKKLKSETDEIESELVKLAEAHFDGAYTVRDRLYRRLADKTKAIKEAEDRIKRI